MTYAEISILRELIALRRAGAIAAVRCDAGRSSARCCCAKSLPPIGRKSGLRPCHSPKRQTPIARIGWHRAKTPGSRDTKTGTHTTHKRAAVGLGAQRFPGERPAGNSPLICGGSHPSGCAGLRAGCASLHRCKWRQGQSRHSAPKLGGCQ